MSVPGLIACIWMCPRPGTDRSAHGMQPMCERCFVWFCTRMVVDEEANGRLRRVLGFHFGRDPLVLS